MQSFISLQLKYFGSEGNGASALRVKDGLCTSKGSVLTHIERSVDALLALEEQVLFWPDGEERKQILKRIQVQYHFPFCISLADGTHLGLAFNPEQHGEEYWTWKHTYSVHVLVFCKYLCQIRHIIVGWPASVHDNRVWKNCRIFLQKQNFFGPNEYELGDLAFNSSVVMVSAYKKVAGCELPHGRQFFNDLLSKPRSKIENMIKILQGLFFILPDHPSQS